MDLTREHLLTVIRPPVTPVDVPELGGTLYLKIMSGAEAFAYSHAVQEADEGHGAATLLAYTLCNREGERLFSTEETPAILQWPFPAIRRLSLEAQRVNALDVTLADAQKNSDETARNGSGSVSPSPSAG